MPDSITTMVDPMPLVRQATDDALATSSSFVVHDHGGEAVLRITSDGQAEVNRDGWHRVLTTGDMPSPTGIVGLGLLLGLAVFIFLATSVRILDGVLLRRRAWRLMEVAQEANDLRVEVAQLRGLVGRKGPTR